MANYSVADAKNTLPKLIDRALAGEEVVITRRGKPVVELRPSAPKRSDPKAMHKWLAERRRGRPSVGITSVELLDLMYEQDEDEHLFGCQRAPVAPERGTDQSGG